MTPFADAHDHVHIYPSPGNDAQIWRGFGNNPERLSCVYVYAIVEYCQCSRLLVNSDKCKKLNSLKHLVRTTVAASHN